MADAPSIDVGQDPRPLILLVEDEVLVRTTLSSMLEFGGLRVIPVPNYDEALEVLAAVSGISVVVTDVKLASSSMDGFALARKIWDQWRIGILVVSGHATPQPIEPSDRIYFVAKPVHQGTLVHLVQDLITLSDNSNQPQETRTTSEGATENVTLTSRQQQVLELLVEGRSNRDIAETLGLAENTVKVHLAAIFRTLNVTSRVEAVLAGMKVLRRE